MILEGNLISGIDFGGKKAKEQENTTETGLKAVIPPGTWDHFVWNQPGTADQSGVPRAEE